ncbi:MAG: magnesium transporter [Spirochaetes bacterium]|nr:magnesium transporter [Spirochaetota bacterium]
MKSTLLKPELEELLEKKDYPAIKEFCEEEHPEIVAEMLGSLEIPKVWQVLTLLSIDRRANIFSRLDEDIQEELADFISRKDLALIISEMPADDRVDLLRRFPEEKREPILSAIAHAEREDIRRLFGYKEGTAGAVMTSEYVTLKPTQTVSEAIAAIRRDALNKETVYYAYIIDEQRKLVGFVSLRDLILSDPNALIQDIMHEEVISVKVDEDQEVAARTIQKYDLIALPVVDEHGVLVGIITHDDAVDIITQEQTEDMEKLMAITGSHEAEGYMKTSSWEHFKRRVVWVVALAALGLVSGSIIHSFEDTLMKLMILALYMPMVADTGGNTGSQTATVVVRALALREIGPKDFFKILFKEIRIALLLGLILGLFAFGKVLFLSQGTYIPPGFSLDRIGLAIAVALGLQVVSSAVVGASLPLLAAFMKVDPAVVASPALTTVVDVTGLLIYFTSAKYILGL